MVLDSQRSVFISYAHKDRDLKDQLLKHLDALRREDVPAWHDREISPGGEWRDQIDERLSAAEVILLLVSPDFIASEYCYDVEVKAALERQARGEATVIPVILRPVDWSRAPFARFQALPDGGKAVTEFRNRDSAFRNITQGVRRAIESRRTEPAVPVTTSVPVPSAAASSYKPSRQTEATASAPAAAPQFRYSNLFAIASFTVPYVVLMNSFENGNNEYRYGDILVSRRSEKWSDLPSAFLSIPVTRHNDREGKCRLEALRWEMGRSSRRLCLEFSEVSYGDYLKSGEHLDDPVPGEAGVTFRDRYAPDMPSTHDFSSSRLTNITGVGVFLITRDDQVIFSRHSDNVSVMPKALSYSASGTMDWKRDLHPFTEVIRECEEETGLVLSNDQLRLFSIGVDAARRYFQFSFVAQVPQTAEEIIRGAIYARDFSFETEYLSAVPFEVKAIVSLVIHEKWEPAAQAGLLTLCAKHHGVTSIEREIDPEFVRNRYRNTMLTEWRHRASRRGHFAVMSDRYPSDDLEEHSELYVSAVMEFLGPDVAGKDVVEIGPGIGRITKRLVGVVAHLTCVELSEMMIARCKENLGAAASRVTFNRGFAEDYRPMKRHDIAICSLVLIHNTDDFAFEQTIRALRDNADTLFLFEHCDPTARTSTSTRTRSTEELLENFPGYQVQRRRNYQLFSDRLVFLKLVQRR